ncbi:potassium channel family protein [Enterobacter hormaechei subsp. oharae]|nr:potassium channel family protein [Enterobacter hormaechei subsp. oharae]
MFELSAEKFNQMRREIDYPPLFELFKKELPRFEKWMKQQEITKEIMFEHGLARFLISDVILYLCKQHGKVYLWDDGVMDFEEKKKSAWIEDFIVLTPYFLWLRGEVGDDECNVARNKFSINTFMKGHHYFMGKVPLRNLGDGILKGTNLSSKLLDFVSLDNLNLIQPMNNSHLYIYCSSAVNLMIDGSVAFLKFKECKLSEIQIKHNGIILQNGSFQEFSFNRCHIDLKLSSANIMHMKVNGCNFNAVCDFARFDSQCEFTYDRKRKFSYQSESDFFDVVTKLFSNANDYSKAGEYYYKKRKALMLESLCSWQNFRDHTFRMTKRQRFRFKVKMFLKSFPDAFNYFAWGFGERPLRALGTSLLIVCLSTIVYYFSAKSNTQTFVEALYFSIVTFTTLGFGDITQESDFLRLFSAVESFSGLVLMGLFLAGYASKTKRY